MIKTAAIITVGSELVEGLRVDTNGPEIARRLEARGYHVDTLVSVGDVREVVAEQVATLSKDRQLVVCTGGLGPTHDDVTREGVCDALGCGLHKDDQMMAFLDQRIVKTDDTSIRTDIMKMADAFDGGELMMPLTGAAPAQVVPTEGGQLLVLPGPPFECLPLFDAFMERYAEDEPAKVDFSICGIPESEIQHAVSDLLPEGIEFTVLASPLEAHVILTDRGAGEKILQQVADKVRQVFGYSLFSDCGKSMAEVVLDLAREKGLKLGSAESCTGGKVAAALTDIPGSSDVFMGGIVSYANEVKMSELGVSSDDLDIYGAVSHQVAAQMAQGARDALGVDLAVATTGIAGPGGGTDDKPVGTVWFGVSDARGTETVLKHRGGDRAMVRAVSTQVALDLLRRRMLGVPLTSQFQSRK